MYGSPEYNSWRCMMARCFNPRVPNFKWYGAQGVSVCEDWLSFEAFFADVGPRPEGCSLDRFDPNGNYEPGNCGWGDARQQAQNRRPRRAAVKRRQTEPPPVDDPPPF
jgi:hypothetical protein